MNFVKMHGLGNDFVIVEVSSWEDADALQPHAKAVCDRNFGVGADGLIAIGRDLEMDVFMRIFNSDGSEPEMCGNGIRCVARYVYEHHLVDKTSVSVRTLAGPIYPEVKVMDGQVVSITVDMGEPILSRALIPMLGVGANVKVKASTVNGEFELTGVSMGNPHCVIFVTDIDKTPVALWGPALETHQLFPAKTNVEFVQVIDRDEMIMRVWERGAGITLACGTGACATLVAAVLNGHTGRAATIHLLGGDLFIEWKEQDNHIYMTGPATEVFSGRIELGQA
ncbi:MAG: diaminopimelate epimerase [Firmicutes bacterium HGW-Firmicutes-15]|nr:MAG: diaminopimelate epimerase [Firmicutes bacterium HGW-Firmicutes-15]